MTTNRVLQERQYLLDACIVKIMKAKRSLSHNDLINEVFNTLKLPINVNFVLSSFLLTETFIISSLKLKNELNLLRKEIILKETKKICNCIIM